MTGLTFHPGWGFDERVFQPVADRIKGRLAGPPTRPLICGWSLGAIHALKAAGAGRLVLVGATPRFTQAPDWPHAQMADVLENFAAAVAADPADALRRFAALMNQGDDHARDLVRHLTGLLREGMPDVATLAAGLDELRDADLRALVPSIRQRVLIVHGERDPLMPLAAAEWLAAHLPDARLEVFAGCAHAPFLSQPDRFADLVAAFANE
ncbi:MAG: alpha/beta fold hydrolase [Candidatus Nitricoxidivorans perseverans]|uniref:Alpha/beta fold hydrolase n=1 Tax=Candidatus Nitricoxidivorans perseverans TaxID=2975601 RepID=A0AA49FNA9_9PROT|nr:MAG: alpha/beta fold hydrolase [Candidatus Nitricoxidivorans perseverans]